jgi:hypothetical protein
MPSPVPAPTAVNWGYTEVGRYPDSGSISWEYRVWVRWSNGGVTNRVIDIPRPEGGGDVNVNAKVWAAIHGLIREGATFRHPDADLPTEPELPDPSGPPPYGRPEPPPPDPDDPLGPADADTTEEDKTRWFPP